MKCLRFECRMLRYWQEATSSFHLHETIAALSVNIRSCGNGTPRGILHPTEDAAIDSREAGLVREHESNYRLILLFMSSGVKEKLGDITIPFSVATYGITSLLRCCFGCYIQYICFKVAGLD